MNKGLNNRVFFIILPVLLVFFFAVGAFVQQNEPIDEKLFQQIDVTGDGIDDKIILHIKGES